MDNSKIAQYYLELLEVFKSVKEEMGEDSPYISFEGNSLDKKIEEAQMFIDAGCNPLAYFEGLSIGGGDSRIYQHDEGIKILINIGKIKDNEKFYFRLIECVSFPLIVEDQYGNSMRVNQRKDS